MYKRVMAIVVAVFMVFGMGIGVFAAETNTTLKYTGTTPVELNDALMDASAYTCDGGLYLPLREICENLGYTVAWSETAGSITVYDENDTIIFNLKDWKINDNGHEFYMTTGNFGSGYVNIDGHVYLYSGMLSNLFSLSVSKDGQTGKVIVTSVSENPVTIKALNIYSASDQLTITLKIPQVYGIANADVQADINEVLRNAALNAQKEGMEYTYEYQNYIEEGSDVSPNPLETYFDYSIEYNRNGILSLVLSDYQYTGGAHGMTVRKSYTFDLNTGKEYSLADLMEDGYVSLVNDTVRKTIDERVESGLLYEFENDPFVTIGEDQDYYLSNEGVVIYFQQYEHFPYAAGFQEVIVSFSSLQKVLKDDFSFLAEE